MTIDKLTTVSGAYSGGALTAQAITASAASTDAIKTVGTKFGTGDRIDLMVLVTADFAASGAATMQIGVQSSTDGSTYTDVILTGAIGKAALTKGTLIRVPVSGDVGTYLRAYYTVATGPMTAGAVVAWFAGD